MQELDDNALLREYVERGSEEAFAALVTRHVNKVYSVALRHTRNPDQAGEITQAVFVILAGKSRRLGKHVILSGWLYQTARLTAVTFIRGEIRRARREQEAHMQTVVNENESGEWTQIAPLLDAAMAGLNETDRHAVVLRFFDGKSFREVGQALGTNEDTVRKRVSRALEKLRLFLAKRGVRSTTAIIAGAISTHSVQVAPVELAKIATTAALAKGSAAGGSTLILAQGVLKIMAWSKAKTVILAGAGILLASGVVVFRHKIQNSIVLARGRYAIAHHIAGPVDLTAAIHGYGTPASYFDKITRFPAWRSVPRGFQVFDHVPLQIDGMLCLWGSRNEAMGIRFPEHVPEIEVNQKFQTLYVYHGAFFASPDDSPVCEVVFRYEDGSAVTNQLLYRTDILEWGAKPGKKANTPRGPEGKTANDPTGPHSRLAWFGGTSMPGKDKPLRFCLTAIENPQPSVTVASIDLHSCKNQTAACIMAMTTGRSGLMR